MVEVDMRVFAGPGTTLRIPVIHAVYPSASDSSAAVGEPQMT